MGRTIYQIGAMLFGIALFLAMSASVVSANSNGQETCPEGNGWVKVDGLSGLEYTYTPPFGYTVTDNCYKASTTVVYGEGPTVESTVWNKEGCPEAQGCNYQELSHASFRIVSRGGYYFQFAKEWKGDAVNLDGVKVTFKVGDFEWQLGDDPVPVKPGQVIEPISEEVTGLPENCTYTSDLPSSYTVPEEEMEEEYIKSIVAEEPMEPQIYTLTATNTVDCEETPVVQGATQVTTTPTGSVDAGGAGPLALFGLVGSVSAISLGAVARRFTL